MTATTTRPQRSAQTVMLAGQPVHLCGVTHELTDQDLDALEQIVAAALRSRRQWHRTSDRGAVLDRHKRARGAERLARLQEAFR